MLQFGFMDELRSLSFLSVVFRLSLAVVIGGLIGLERGWKGRPAGFRTHMLVCLGSTLATLVNFYSSQHFDGGDPTRIAAQVVSGIGFLGAGTIMITGHFQRQVRGLTTAAGLWSSACVGIAVGTGFYEAALITFLLILIIMMLLHGLDERIHRGERELCMFAEFIEIRDLSDFIKALKTRDCHIQSVDISQRQGSGSSITTVVLSIRFPARRMTADQIIDEMQMFSGLVMLERLI